MAGFSTGTMANLAQMTAEYYEAPDDDHFADCEDGKHWQCHCGHFFLDWEAYGKSRNLCPECLYFAPRPKNCICPILKELYSEGY